MLNIEGAWSQSYFLRAMGFSYTQDGRDTLGNAIVESRIKHLCFPTTDTGSISMKLHKTAEPQIFDNGVNSKFYTGETGNELPAQVCVTLDSNPITGENAITVEEELQKEGIVLFGNGPILPKFYSRDLSPFERL